MHNESAWKREKTEKGAKKIVKEIIAKELPIFDKKAIYTSKKFNKVQRGKKQGDPYLDIS